MRKATVLSQFWSRGSGRALRGNPKAQVLALWAFSAPAGNDIGLFYAPLAQICAETGLESADVREGFGALGILDIAHYDAVSEAVWVPRAAVYQGAATARSVAKRKEILTVLASFGDHAFAKAFREKYPQLIGLDVPAPPTKKSADMFAKTKGKTFLPDEWEPNEAHKERAKNDGTNWPLERDKFRAHAKANGRQQVDWNSSFTTWLIKSAEFRNKDTKPASSVIEWEA